jgi:hypothetical protein
LAVFVELTTDGFADTFVAKLQDTAKSRRAGASRARRPLRGLEIKDDTYAILKVVKASGEEIRLIDSGSVDGGTTQYTNFILQSVQEARMEKHQIVQTFGEPYIYFFGEQPRFLDVTAVLVDSFDFNWYAEFWENYDRYLRGTKLVEMGARCYLFYDDNIVEGYMLQAQCVKTSELPLMVQLSFRLFLTNYSNITFISDNATAADPNYPIRAGVNLPADVTLTAGDAFTVAAADVGIQETNGPALSDAQMQLIQAGGQQQLVDQFGGASALERAAMTGATLQQNIPGNLADAVLAAFQASGAMPGGLTRSTPLRSKISDNVDEFTGPAAPTTSADPSQSEEDRAGMDEVEDLSDSAITQAQDKGADINNPSTLNSLGLGPSFKSPVGQPLNSGSNYSSATFGPSSYGSTTNGINGGFGLSGIFSNGSNVTSTSTYAGTLRMLSSATSFSPSAAGASPGLSSGTGVGGGTRGKYSSVQTSQGIGAFIGTSNAASVPVGGTSSAFAMALVSGTLLPGGGGGLPYNTGPDGSYSPVNTTGYYV